MSTPSAQTDSFVRDRLPPREQWPEFRYDLPELQIPDQANVATTLLGDAIAKGWGNRLMLRAPGETYTYAEANAQVNRIAEMLIKDYKLEPGNRVLLRGGNSIGMALAWLGVVKAGLIAVATMPLLRAVELDKIIDKAQPALALCEQLHCHQVAHPGAARQNPQRAGPWVVRLVLGLRHAAGPGARRAAHEFLLRSVDPVSGPGQ